MHKMKIPQVFTLIRFLPFIYPLKYQSKNTQLHIAGCKIGYCLCKLLIFNFVAVRTGLEPVTPCVTGMYSNQLN